MTKVSCCRSILPSYAPIPRPYFDYNASNPCVPYPLKKKHQQNATATPDLGHGMEWILCQQNTTATPELGHGMEWIRFHLYTYPTFDPIWLLLQHPGKIYPRGYSLWCWLKLNSRNLSWQPWRIVFSFSCCDWLCILLLYFIKRWKTVISGNLQSFRFRYFWPSIRLA